MEFIYLDNNATTRVAPEVLEAVLPYWVDFYGNAASVHRFGKKINAAVNVSRNQIAALIDCEPNEIVFTSGATEAINLAIKGVAESHQDRGQHIITVQTEHPAVLDVCRFLETRGYEITYLPVSADGIINLGHLTNALRSDTILVAIMMVNNETGVIQPIKRIAELVHNAGALFMTDATQAVGRMPIDVDELDIDLMAFSAHKFYGPKGIGGLFIRERLPRRVQITASIHGGGHERGLRSGTLNVPGIVGMGKACELAQQLINTDAARVEELRNRLEEALLTIEGTSVNGSRLERLYNVTNITFPNLDANVLIGQLKNLAVSNGSACASAVFEPSHVLMAMGLTGDEAFGSIRFSLGRYSTLDEIIEAIRLIQLHLNTMHQY